MVIHYSNLLIFLGALLCIAPKLLNAQFNFQRNLGTYFGDERFV
jgi:hypothetical protein